MNSQLRICLAVMCLSAIALQPRIAHMPLILQARGFENVNSVVTDLPGEKLPKRSIARLGSIHFRHQELVTCVCFSADGLALVAGDWEGQILLWDATSGRKVRRFSGHEGRVNCLALSPDGKILVSGSSDHTIRSWDV